MIKLLEIVDGILLDIPQDTQEDIFKKTDVDVLFLADCIL